MGDSVPKHTGPISLTDTHLEPSVLRTRPTTTRENRRRWKGLIPRDTQAACRFNCLASNSTPFFQMVNVMAAIFRARVRRAIDRKSTRLNSSHANISYAVFRLKKNRTTLHLPANETADSRHNRARQRAQCE